MDNKRSSTQISVLTELASSSTRRTKGLCYAQDELVSSGHVVGADLVVGVGEDGPCAVIHDSSGAYSANLLAGLQKLPSLGVGASAVIVAAFAFTLSSRRGRFGGAC
jgi:hypothetical protein